MSYTIKKIRGQHIFQKINYIQIESHSGCTRQCEFCGIMHDKKHISMSKEVFTKILEGIDNHTKKLSFSLNGEPFLNKELPALINIARLQVPTIQISVITNFDVFTKNLDVLWDAFNKGMNIVHIDLYDDKSYNRFKEFLTKEQSKLSDLNIDLKNYHGSGYNCWTYHGSTQRTIIYCDSRTAFKTVEERTRVFHIWGGNLKEDYIKSMGIDIHKDFPLLKPCIEPLTYIAFDAEGNQLLCCASGTNGTKLNNIKDYTTYELWTSELFNKYRYALKYGRRDLIPNCYLCNRKCFRSGLYPYWGKNKYELDELESFFSSKNQCSIESFMKHNLISIKDTIKNKSLVSRLEE